MNNAQVAVASRSFSQDSFLRNELLSRYSNVRFNETGRSLAGDELVSFLRDAEKAIIALERIDSDLLSKLPKLKLISKYGVGLDNVDFESLFKSSVKLAWTPGVNKRAVAELALHFILGVCRGSFLAHSKIRNQEWLQVKGRNFSGMSVGLLGLGHVAQDLVKLLKPFELKIFAYDCNDRSSVAQEEKITMCSLETLLSESDVVSLHLPLTKQTKRLLSRERLLQMKKGSFLVNTARGSLIDESALYDLLKNEHLAGAAFDVFEHEPALSSPLLSLENFYSTSHIGGSSREAIRLMGLAAIEGLDRGKDALPEQFFDYPL